MQSGHVHNSQPCIDCVSHFKKMLHTIKYLVYTTKKDGDKSGYSMEKVHFRDYKEVYISTGHLYRENIMNT